MASQEDRQKHRRRLQNKKRDKKKIPSPIAKSLEEPQFHQRVIRDKRGKTHDLETLTHKELVELIQEKE